MTSAKAHPLERGLVALPEPIVRTIASWLDVQSRCRLAAACKLLSSVTRHASAWPPHVVLTIDVSRFDGKCLRYLRPTSLSILQRQPESRLQLRRAAEFNLGAFALVFTWQRLAMLTCVA
jgi:hypothetical protein